MTRKEFYPGGYCYLPSVFQYSAGIAALPSYRVERVTFQRPVPLRHGFRHAERIIKDAGRPLTAFCACELRSPAQFSETAFRSFNELYVSILAQWGLVADGTNPVARSNVCPEIFAPGEPYMRAFSYVARSEPGGPGSFVISGSGEVPEGRPNYRDYIVSPGDVGPKGMRDKVRFVRNEMERRLRELGQTWANVTATQLYTVHDFHSCVLEELITPGAAQNGLCWHFCRPPIVGLDFEMDCRGGPYRALILAMSDKRST